MSKVSPKKFIHAWQTSGTLAEVARKTGMTKTAISARGNAYKKRGISLRKLTKSKVYDWEELRDYAAKLMKVK